MLEQLIFFITGAVITQLGIIIGRNIERDKIISMLDLIEENERNKDK